MRRVYVLQHILPIGSLIESVSTNGVKIFRKARRAVKELPAEWHKIHRLSSPGLTHDEIRRREQEGFYPKSYYEIAVYDNHSGDVVERLEIKLSTKFRQLSSL